MLKLIHLLKLLFIFIDPISILTEKYDSQLKNGQIKKKKGVHNDIIQATAKLKLDLNIVNEEGVPSTTESRQIRINELAKLLSPAYVIPMLIICVN